MRSRSTTEVQVARGELSRESIREAALDLYAQNGEAGTSLQMIADKLGVTKAAIYYHFKTKAGVTRAVLAPAMDGFVSMVEQASRMDSPRERQRYLIGALADQAVANRDLYVVTLQDASAMHLLQERPENSELFERLRALLAGDDPSAEQTLKAQMFLLGLVAPVPLAGTIAMEDADIRNAITEAGLSLLSPCEC